MKKYDFIGIKEQTIYGVKNPLLHIQGTIKLEHYDFIVYADTEEIKFELTMLGEKDNFLLTAKLPNKTKNVKVFIKYDDKLKLISSLNNKLLGRLYRKIKTTARRIYLKIKLAIIMIFRGIKFLWREHHFLVPPALWKKYIKYYVDKIKSGIVNNFYDPFRQNEYLNWIKENECEETIINFEYNPLISILIPVYNIGEKYLTECIESILNQSYQNFEICLVDDASTKEETIKTLKKYEDNSKIKIKYRDKNGHISRTTNDALELSSGEFVALVDNDDLLSKNALYEVVKVLNENKNLDMIYSDEDKIDFKGNRCDPHFKPDFSPDTLLSLNYICHLAVLRKTIVDEIGGFTVGLEGAQDHDLFLRFTEKTNKIHHISKILYHWRKIEGSTSVSIDNKNYANDLGKKAIEEALKRRNIKGHVEKDVKSTYYKVTYEFEKEPLVSLIIPTRDYAETLKTCLDSIYEKTTYKNYEIIIANNNSEKKETFDLFDDYKNKHDNFKVIDVNTEFNYSHINNVAVKESNGEYIVLLNNDTEIITEDWLTILIGYASQSHIGAVGPKLLYPDYSVQHGGVILGLGGVASHAYIGSSREDLGMYGRLSVPYNYSAVTAACLAISRKKFDEVNGLEEELKVAYNDIDFNIKLLQKGYYNVFVPQVEIIHFESKSRGLDTTSEKYKRFLIESDYMYTKWKLDTDRFYNPNFSKKGWFVLDKKNKEK
ncbi:MAG: glycosyltransferase family 2 protein [Bacilli bacterium]|nr:glycosyltransferase family 2 protein [Bacilli bacterium]